MPQPSPDGSTFVPFRLALGEAILSGTALVPVGITTLTELLPVLRRLEQSGSEAAIEGLASRGQPISCRQACSACCDHLVPVTLFEAESLSFAIRAMPPPQQHALADRFRSALQQLAASGLNDRIQAEDWIGDTPSARHIVLDYLYQRIPCPFLVDSACSVYELRPFACREYLVVSPPAHCADPAANAVVRVNLPLRLFPILNRIGASVFDDTRGWFPLVLLLAWMEADPHPGDSVSAPGLELFHEILTGLGASAASA